jgi:uncharacterized protein YjbI with pentapeptide repeats
MGVCLVGVYLTGVHLIGSHLTGVHLIGVYLIGVHLIGVHITGVHLIGVYLTGVYLIGVHLTGVYLIGLYLTDVARHSQQLAIKPICNRLALLVATKNRLLIGLVDSLFQHKQNAKALPKEEVDLSSAKCQILWQHTLIVYKRSE